MSKVIRVRKGLNIRLEGNAEMVIANADRPETIAIQPPDIHGLIPKLDIKPGEEVKAGTPLFHDKDHEYVKLTSTVSGEVVEVVRGAKRKILQVKILADKETRYEDFGAADPNSLSREQVIEKLLNSGTWPFIRQRPFDVIADPSEKPKSIFISGIDTNPLAPDNDFVVRNQGEDLQAGIDAVKKLTDGTVHLCLGQNTSGNELTSAKGVEIHRFSGPHPAGNVGVQIHNIDPINKGEVVWYLYPQDLIIIGRLFRTGKYDAQRIIAVTGASAMERKYKKVLIGAPIKSIIGDNIEAGDIRVISGNVLTGTNAGIDGNLGYYDTQITAIPEGKEPKFFLTKGWLAPGFDKFSMSMTFPTWMTGSKKFNLDTNLNGEERAFVVSGQYEKVFPFDIYPVQLVKSIIFNDIDQMEKLGIYEVGPEDFALCEYVCTSKINVQNIVRGGLDTVKAETT